MSNPYHDEHGKFCSKEEMRGAVDRLREAGKHEEATSLFLEYKNASIDKAVAVHGELKSALKGFFRTNLNFEGDIHETPTPDTFKSNPDSSLKTGTTDADKVAAAGSFVDQERYRNIKKMPALFVIDREAHEATTEINENAAWIFTEPSTPTIKRDGTSITVTEDGTVLARRSVKKGKQAPPGFIHAETDSYTGHQFGVEPIEQSGFNKMFQEAAAKNGGKLEPGTYELCGPKVNGNPEKLDRHSLIRHGAEVAGDIPDMRTVPRAEAFEKLREIFKGYKEDGIEGIVWAGADGKRTKLRVKDFFGDPDRR